MKDKKPTTPTKTNNQPISKPAQDGALQQRRPISESIDFVDNTRITTVFQTRPIPPEPKPVKK